MKKDINNDSSMKLKEKSNTEQLLNSDDIDIMASRLNKINRLVKRV